MKTAAIICEYNPFHNGHKFHIEETKRLLGADAIVLIMSGNFVQRGDVAVFDKSIRAQAAIEGGADLCIELPTIYSSASAEFFATGAIKTLDAFGIIDYLSFGAESTDLTSLFDVARFLVQESEELSLLIKHYSSSGISYPNARAKAVEKLAGSSYSSLLSSPNNILATEYCKALISLDSHIKPFPILRKGASHDSKTPLEEIASATFIRDLILSGKSYRQFVPDFAYELFKNAAVHSIKGLEKTILFELTRMPAEELKSIADVAEGLENRIKSCALQAKSLDELIEMVKTKRYTHSRISRIILSALLGISAADRATSPAYIKVLAHNKTGQKLISTAKKTAKLPIVRNTSQINKLSDTTAKEMWEKERLFDNLYKLSEI